MEHLEKAREAAYWDLYREGVDDLHAARLAEAESVLERALQEARRRRLRLLADRAYCNWAAVRIERGLPAEETGPIVNGLSAVLGRSPDLKARQLAAYDLACLYRAHGRTRPGRLYAEIAGRLAATGGDVQSQAVSRHLLGLLWLGEGRMDQARQCLEEALEMGLHGDRGQGAVALSTLGYCLSLTGEPARGMRLLEQSLASLGGPLSPLYEPSLHLNIGFACLELGDLDAAIHHGEHVLRVERREGRNREESKHARYLVGEALAQKGSAGEAREHFEVLRREFYPEIPDLSELLLACRTHSLLNWLA
jgi:tetratricopeptide (TPR) repeat protein